MRRRSPAFLFAVAVAALVAVALVHVWVHLQVIQAGYELGRESKARHDLVEQNQKLRLELATRRNPAEIERHAREVLHMAPPDPSAIRVVRMGEAGRLAAREPR